MAFLVGVDKMRVATAPPPDASSGLARLSYLRDCWQWRATPGTFVDRIIASM
jgi:hypothetical protein